MNVNDVVARLVNTGHGNTSVGEDSHEPITTMELLRQFISERLLTLGMSDCNVLDAHGTEVGGIITVPNEGKNCDWNFVFSTGKFLVFYRRFPLAIVEALVYEIN